MTEQWDHPRLAAVLMREQWDHPRLAEVLMREQWDHPRLVEVLMRASVSSAVGRGVDERAVESFEVVSKQLNHPNLAEWY